MGPRRMGPPSSPEDWKAIEWFREGFVTYYAYTLAWRAGLIQLPDYLENLNRDIRTFPGSGSVYVRGHVIAVSLNSQIRKDSGGKRSLDTVMFDLVNESAKPLTQSRILETAGRYLSPSSRTEFARAIRPDSSISLAEDALRPCARGSIEQVPTFDLGFDLGSSTTLGSITGIEPNGPAFQAGLRDGQQLSGRLSVYNNQPDKAAIVTVQTGQGRKAVEYYPRGKPVAVMQYHLDRVAYGADPGSCQLK
jgi:predicted metalloprotease with PDZ domain